MGLDPLSPVAPARVNVLLLPVGKIKRSRFLSLAARLQAENVVRLGDISPDARGDKSFSPLAFPTGSIIYDISLSHTPSFHLDFFPFEVSREPFAVIGIADGTQWHESEGSEGEAKNQNQESETKAKIETLVDNLKAAKSEYRRALIHQLLIFELVQPPSSKRDVIFVPSPEASTTTTMKTVMCDISALLLTEMALLAKEVQNYPTIESPKATKSPNGLSFDPSIVDRVNSRMSMPATLQSRPNGHSEQSPGSGSRLAVNRTPSSQTPTTFDEITRSVTPQNIESTSSRPSSASDSHEHSRERASVQSLSSMTPSERKKSRTKGRSHIIIGSLYLQAGRWPDALKELVEGALLVRANSDYLWHARALEYILICLILYGWAGMDFQIPQICYPIAEKGSPFPKSQQSMAAGSNAHLASPTSGSASSQLPSLQSLTSLLPDLFNTILNLYSRAANFTDESLPQLLYSETVLHFAKLLAAVHLRDGLLDRDVLRHAVLNVPLKPTFNSERLQGRISIRKSDIATMVFRAMLSSNTDLNAMESMTILIGMTSVLSSVDLQRKSAFIMKEVLYFLIPSLVQARKVGAAEMGIHPAAGLLTLNASGPYPTSPTPDQNEMGMGLRALLLSVAEVHGVPGPKDGISQSGQKDETDPTSDGHLLETLERSTLRDFGNFALKVDILKSCINFCEALPDFQGVLLFTVELLHTIRRGLLLPLNHHEGAPNVPQEEQARLLNSIKRTVGAAAKLGMPSLQAEYWDEFLVRNVELLEPPLTKKPLPHAKRDLDVIGAAADATKKSPFIYNPFAKTGASTTEQVLVADELAQFRVTLQNPYEFDLEVESIRLHGDGCTFETTSISFVIGPYCLQNIILSGIARSSGTLKITGCFVKIRYCRERKFLFYKDPWKPKANTKAKRIGLAARSQSVQRPLSTNSEASRSERKPPHAEPAATALTVNVIPPQPVISAEFSSLAQPAIMVLEGETKTFEITIQNTSTTTAVDLLLFVFQDSATKQLQSAISNKEIAPAELFEFEWQLANKPALKWHPATTEDLQPTIAPGKSARFIIEVLGKPGLLEAVIQIDYAHLGVPKSEVKDKFYTRQLLLPLTITVNAGAEVLRCDILPFSTNFAWANQRSQDQQPALNGTPETSRLESQTIPGPSSGQLVKKEENKFALLLSRLGLGSHDEDHCLLLLDIRNGWPYPLSVSVQILQLTDQLPSSNGAWHHIYGVHELLQPGHTSRVVLLIPRIHIADAHAPIPSLSHSRQYVVSATKSSIETEAAIREAFWYREELLKHVRGTWKEEASERGGDIDFRRGIRLNPRMIEAIRIEEVDVSLSISAPPTAGTSFASSDGSSSQNVTQTGRSRFVVVTNCFLTLTTRICNRTASPILPLLRLQPSMRNQPHNIALDLSKRLAWTGMLQQTIVPLLQPGETRDVKLGITALCRGDFEVGASVEEVKVWKDEEAAAKGKDAGVPLIERNERRIWYAREACLIDARDVIDNVKEED